MFPFQLLPPLEETGYFASDYRMSDDAIFELARTLIRFKPKTVLETGPGMSSYVFFRYQQLMLEEEDTRVNYHVVDQGGEWHGRFKERMRRYGFPFHSVWTFPLHDDYYDVSGLDLGEMDLISLDGPDTSRGRNSEPARRFIDRHMGPKTMFLVDDTNRRAESDLVLWIYERRLYRFRDAAKPFSSRTVIDTLYPKRCTTFITPV